MQYFIYCAILALAAVVFFSLVSSAIKSTEYARVDCEVLAGGHFVNNRGYECWSLDGTKRLFPSEKF